MASEDDMDKLCARLELEPLTSLGNAMAAVEADVAAQRQLVLAALADLLTAEEAEAREKDAQKKEAEASLRVRAPTQVFQMYNYIIAHRIF